MSQLRFYSIIGDSNVKRNMTPAVTKGRPPMVSAKIILCGRLSVLPTSLASVPSESDAVVLACVSNFLTSSPPASSVSQRACPVFQSFLDKIVAFALSHTNTKVFLCPPMYRTAPLWYRDGLPEILTLFSTAIRDMPVRPGNVLIMPGFPQPHLEADGVHLDAFSGLKYVMHLFDASQEIVDSLNLDESSRVNLLTEESRSISARVTVIEQDHARLSKSFELQSAITAEAMDWQINLKNEDFIMVQGLQRLPKLDQKEWQVRARAAVDQVISDMGFPHKVLYVQNLTGRGAGSKTLYKAKMENTAVSRQIRDKFSSYFAGGQDSRPQSLAGLSVRNCVTPGTLARVAILQLLGKRYRESNPGSRVQVQAYEARPVLKLTPPPGASDTRVMTFGFIEAISKLPTNFGQDEVDNLLKRISPSLLGSLRQILVVISDDMIKKKFISKKKKSSAAKSTAAESEVVVESDSSEFRTPEAIQGRKRGPSGSGSASGPSAKR